MKHVKRGVQLLIILATVLIIPAEINYRDAISDCNRTECTDIMLAWVMQQHGFLDAEGYGDEFGLWDKYKALFSRGPEIVIYNHTIDESGFHSVIYSYDDSVRGMDGLTEREWNILFANAINLTP